MKTQLEVLKEERIDDVPLLIGTMQQLKIAEVVDKHLPPHHLHQGVSFGTLAVGWLAYILSEADHRKSAVRDWATGLEHTLPILLGQSLRPSSRVLRRPPGHPPQSPGRLHLGGPRRRPLPFLLR